MQLTLLQEESLPVSQVSAHQAPSSPSKKRNQIPSPPPPLDNSQHMASLASMIESEAQSFESGNTREKSPTAFKTISEAAALLEVPQHVLRFWESRFAQIKPLKLRGGRRYYRPEDIEVLAKIKHLLYKQGYTIKGAKKAFFQTPGFKLPPAAEKESVPVQTAPKKLGKPTVSPKQKKHLTNLREELFQLRATLVPYIS